MIYPDHKLFAWASLGSVTPFDPDSINPASIDLRLGNRFTDLSYFATRQFEADSISISPAGTMFSTTTILATTLEYIKMPANAAGVVYLKSSLARQGLDHALAGWVDSGFHGQLTLELHAHRLITLHAGQPIIQLVLMKTDGAVSKPYDGKYQGQRGPTEAR